MSRQSKLINKFLSILSDFTWDELTNVLSAYGYYEIKTGKTGGSGRRFANEDKSIIMLHKPHPGNIVKKYAMRQVIDFKSKGKN